MLSAQIRFCREHIHAGAGMIAALDGDGMVGLGIVTREIGPQTSQLAFLHASRAYVRFGFATTADPLLELFSLDPEDIHMMREL